MPRRNRPSLSTVFRRFFRLCRALAPALAAAASLAAAPLRIGVEPMADQLSHLDAAGQPQGYAVDIARAVAADQHLELEFVARPWPELLDEFRAGRIDILAAAVATPERESFIAFSLPHVDLQSSLFVNERTRRPRQLADVGQLTLATTERSAGHEFYVRQGWTKVQFYPRLRDALGAIDRGECDGVVAVRLIAKNFINANGYAHVVETDFDLSEMHYRLRFGVHPEARLLLYQLNEGLAHLAANGGHDQVYEKWIGPLEPRHVRPADLKPLLAPAAVLVIAIVGAFLWQRRLLRRLKLQTAQLRESEQRLRHVFEGSEDGFWDWDLATGKLERSERWASMLGYTLEEIGPTLAAGTSLVHPDDLAVYELWQQRLNVGSVDRYDIEYRMRAKSGEWRWILDRGKVVARDVRGHPLRMAGTHTDVTARKNTEAALIESQALLKRSAHLLEQAQAMAQMGGWEFDLRTDRLFWTRETYRLHETTPEEFHPTVDAAIQFYTPESRPAIRSALEAATRHGLSYTLELDVVTAKGRAIRVRTTGAAERDGAHVVKIYGTFQDITAEKIAEAEREKLRLKMLEAQKLESLGVLAGGIAHDFNNLLTVILANATFVRADSAVDDERLAHIESAARRAADLCRQMLAYAGKGSFVVEQIDLGALVRDTAQLIRVSISKKARLELELAPGLPAVQGDVSQLRQVVMNLVINASEALGDGAGDIRLVTRAARPDPAAGGMSHAFDLPPGDCVCLEIADTGHGMSPATLARIFDPFFTTKFAGRGLGLAAVLGIVRAHNGALTVQSTPGHGSRFRLFLPASRQPAKPTPAAPAPETPARNGHGTILVADDEPVVLATADAVLRHHGYATVLAHDGHEAVRRFKAEPAAFSAVLLDLTMPGLDGAEVLRTIRAVQPKVRVLVMSGFSEQDVFSRLRGLGEVAILRKPFTQETLVARIREVARP